MAVDALAAICREEPMTELAGDVQPVFLSPDRAYAWWGGAWKPLESQELSPEGQWVMLDGKWRPVAAQAPITPEPPHFATPAALPQQAYSGNFAQPQQVYAPGPYAANPYSAGRYPAGGQPDSGTNGLAIASLVLGIVWLAGLGSLLAVIFGNVARGQIKTTRQAGNRLAIAGLVLGYLGLAAGVAAGITAVTSDHHSSSAPGQRSTNGYDASLKSDLRTVAEEVESQNVDNQDYTQTTFGAGPAVPGTSLSSGNLVTVGGERIDLSPGDTVTWVGGTSVSYCLRASSSHTSVVWYYDSARGGITATACT